LQARIEGAIHDAHAAFAEPSLNVIVPQTLADQWIRHSSRERASGPVLYIRDAPADCSLSGRVVDLLHYRVEACEELFGALHMRKQRLQLDSQCVIIDGGHELPPLRFGQRQRC
jgi:hypothetical protein